MIEVIYKEENEEPNNNVTVKTPKNIKQIGDGDTNKKIYIEDYVMNFIKQAPKDPDEIKYGVLLGEIKKGNGCTYIFVSGGLTVKGSTNNSIIFDGEVWTQIYEDIRSYFNQLEIIGWFASYPFNDKSNIPTIRKNHLDNFAGNDKVFFGYDRTENDEGFYLYEAGVLSKQDSYFIYYERNESMQEYLVDNNLSSSPERAEVIKREGSYRSLIASKKEKLVSTKKEKEPKVKEFKEYKLASPVKTTKKATKKFSSLASSILIIFLLIGVIAFMENYGEVKSLTANMQNLAGNIFGNKETTSSDDIINDEGETVEIETVNGNVKPTEETTSSETTTVSETQTSTEVTTQANVAQQRYYTVKEGESLYKICRTLYNDTSLVQKIVELNNLSSPDDIQAGQSILLPY